MAQMRLRVMAVVGSLKKESVSRAVLRKLADMLSASGCEVDWLDLAAEPLPLFNPDTAKQGSGYAELRKRVEAADVFILGTPDYHGAISSALKNFLDYFWHEFSGKLFIPVVASHEKGLTTIDQIRTIARQCYAWVLPYGAAAADKTDVAQGQIVSKSLQDRLEMLARDARVYGTLLARQRAEDLACEDCTFMARHRPK
jgi:FMN reductase